MNALITIEAITLRKVLADLLASRKLKPVTIKNYNRNIGHLLEDWLDLPLVDISKSMIEVRHKHIRGQAAANKSMRVLRNIFEYAKIRYEDAGGNPLITSNPVSILTQTRAWYKDNRRRTVVHPNDLPKLIKGIYSAPTPAFRDFLLLLLFTGMRRSEAMNLTWSQVDLQGGTITLLDTKNGEDRVVPLSSFIWKVLTVRRYFATNHYVFSSSFQVAPIACGTKTINHVRQQSGVKFNLHDLRRTFASMADLAGLNVGLIACLIGHKSKSVTEGYTIRSTERLRRASQKVADLILQRGELVSTFPDAELTVIECTPDKSLLQLSGKCDA